MSNAITRLSQWLEGRRYLEEKARRQGALESEVATVAPLAVRGTVYRYGMGSVEVTFADLDEVISLALIGQRCTREACAASDLDEVQMADLHIPGGETR